MRILIVAATSLEIMPLLQEFNAIENSEDLNLFQTKLRKRIHLDVLITGAGINHTAFHLGRILEKNNYDLAINAGICGSFKKKIILGTTVEVLFETMADFGAEKNAQFLTASQLKLYSGSEKIILQDTIENNSPPLQLCDALQKVKGITVNTVHGKLESIRAIKRRLNPDTESMEGFTFFYACRFFNIPFYQIRTVSNFVEPRNKSNWNIPLAVGNLNKFLIKAIKEISG